MQYLAKGGEDVIAITNFKTPIDFSIGVLGF
jgi:hypothetical protein